MERVMLTNYAKDRNGVIRQVERETVKNYDAEYVVERYSKAPVLEMSHLRLGYVLGSIGGIPQTLLDVGYGQGDFLKAARKIVPNVFGYDIPPAYPVQGVEIVSSLYDRVYDVVTFFDSLEHFEDIYEIRALRAKYIVVSVPWCHYFSDEWFLNWKHRRPDEHLWHFDLSCLDRFMADIGYGMLSHSAVEDAIRKTDGDWKNILTATFSRKRPL